MNQDFPDATGYAIKSGEEQLGEMLKSLLAILAILGARLAPHFIFPETLLLSRYGG
jgi:hypothetical protein